MTCETHFEDLVAFDAPDPPCPHCGVTKVARQLSVFTAQGSMADSSSSFTGSSGGGCCGGGCGCG